MSIVDSVDFAADFLTVVTTFAVFVQLWFIIRQMKLDAFIRVQENNRELVRLGIENPEMLRYLTEEAEVNDPRALRYGQLWINQMNLVFRMYQAKQLSSEEWGSMREDLAEFMKVPLIRQQWLSAKRNYPASFQQFADSFLDSKISK
jgi:hypothetical protein